MRGCVLVRSCKRGYVGENMAAVCGEGGWKILLPAGDLGDAEEGVREQNKEDEEGLGKEGDLGEDGGGHHRRLLCLGIGARAWKI